MGLKKLNGLISVIKPTGITSAQLCNIIRNDLLRELGVPPLPPDEPETRIKIGHGGTLDLEASGVVPIGLGNGCRYLPRLLRDKKRYIATGCLGTRTSTDNNAGEVVETLPYGDIEERMLNDTLSEFVGEIKQKPPIYSALKHQGERISDIARRGDTIPEKAFEVRNVTVYSSRLLQFNPPLFTIDVTCGGGFYMRSLVRDIGEMLETCAYVVDLQRIEHGLFTQKYSIPTGEWTFRNVITGMKKNRELLNKALSNAHRKQDIKTNFKHNNLKVG